MENCSKMVFPFFLGALSLYFLDLRGVLADTTKNVREELVGMSSYHEVPGVLNIQHPAFIAPSCIGPETGMMQIQSVHMLHPCVDA